MAIEIIEEKLEAVYKAASTGSVDLKDPKAVQKIVRQGGNPVTVGRAYITELKSRWPDEFGDDKAAPEANSDLPDDDEDELGFGELDDEEEAEDPAPAPAPAPAPVKSVVVEKTPDPTPAQKDKVVQQQVEAVGLKGKTAPAAPIALSKAFLEKADGTSEELEIVTVAGSVVIVREKVPTDIVTIMLRGQPFTVDLEHLKRQPAATMIEGLTVSRLIDLATAAKG